MREFSRSPTVDKYPGRTTELLQYNVEDQVWTSTRYDQVLSAACGLAGYPVHFASHDIRVACIRAAVTQSCESQSTASSSNLNSPAYRLQEIQYAIGHSTASDTWTKYMGGTSSVLFQHLLFGTASNFEYVLPEVFASGNNSRTETEWLKNLTCGSSVSLVCPRISRPGARWSCSRRTPCWRSVPNRPP